MSDLPAVTTAYRHAYREYHAAKDAERGAYALLREARQRAFEATDALANAERALLDAIAEDA